LLFAGVGQLAHVLGILKAIAAGERAAGVDLLQDVERDELRDMTIRSGAREAHAFAHGSLPGSEPAIAIHPGGQHDRPAKFFGAEKLE
jgi:hypothetical protein